MTRYNVVAFSSPFSNVSSSSLVDSSGTSDGEPDPRTWKKCSRSDSLENSSKSYGERVVKRILGRGLSVLTNDVN